MKDKSLIVEVSLVTSVVLVLARVFYSLRGSSTFGSFVSIAVAILLLYVPIGVMWYRGRSVDFLDRSGRDYLRSCLVFLVASVLVFPLFFLLAHAWQVVVFRESWSGVTGIPHLFNAVLFQLLLVSLPEEFYFRGYFQSAMDSIFAKRWRILGADLGWGWLATAFVFAIAHTIVFYRWWHFAIFFPALLFGYLRERTGSITSSVLFHAASNVFINWFVRCYV